MQKTKLGFLVSHRGTNMQAVIDACKEQRLAAEPVAVITNNPDCGAVHKAQQASIPYFVVNSRSHQNPDQSMVEILHESGAELIVLAGYMKKIGDRLLQAYNGRLVNIHPSLLPRHGGRGMYGHRVHEAVLASGDRCSGATVHLVEQEYDKGPILAQRSLPVAAGETPESLAARVLAIEHELLVETLHKLISGDLQNP